MEDTLLKMDKMSLPHSVHIVGGEINLLNLIKIIGSSVLVVITCIGCLIPVWIKRKRRSFDLPGILLNSLASGTFLGYCILHLFPEAMSHNSHTNLGLDLNGSWMNFTPVLIFIGWTVVLFIEKVVAPTAVTPSGLKTLTIDKFTYSAEVKPISPKSETVPASDSAFKFFPWKPSLKAADDFSTAVQMAATLNTLDDALSIKNDSTVKSRAFEVAEAKKGDSPVETHNSISLAVADSTPGSSNGGNSARVGSKNDLGTPNQSDAISILSKDVIPDRLPNPFCIDKDNSTKNRVRRRFSQDTKTEKADSKNESAKFVPDEEIDIKDLLYQEIDSEAFFSRKYDQFETSCDAYKIRPMAAFASIFIHSLFEGVVLGLSQEPSILVSRLVGIGGHKWAEGFLLACQFCDAHESNRTMIIFLSLFIMASPLGCFIGSTFGEIDKLDCICSAVASGMILYVTAHTVIDIFSSNTTLSQGQLLRRKPYYTQDSAKEAERDTMLPYFVFAFYLCGAGLMFGLVIIHHSFSGNHHNHQYSITLPQ